MFNLGLKKVDTEKVFGVSNDLILSYVERPDVDKAFTNALLQNKQIIIYGSSKQGKTSLLLKHLNPENYVKVECTPNSRLIDIYISILRQCNVKILSSVKEEKQVEVSGKISAKASIEIPMLVKKEIGGEGGLKGTTKDTEEYQSLEYNLALAQSIIEILKAYKIKKYVVLENFHYLKEEEQRDFSFDLRTFQDENIPFIILGIWRERNRLAQYNGDLQDRLIEIPVEPWKRDDFKKVVNKGEKYLNVDFSNIIGDLINAAFDSIGVLQELAKETCIAASIKTTPLFCKVLSKNHLEEAIKHKHEDYSTRHIKSLESFIDNTYGNKKEELYKLTDLVEKRKHPLYIPNYFINVLLNSSFEDIEKGLERKDIHERIQKLHYRPDDVRSGDMTNFLHNIIGYQINKKIAPPLFDYDTGSRKLKIIDSTLYFFLKYTKGEEIICDLDL